ncbi:MAG: hypothetical protein ACFE96_17910 [Candidatus Hermodarchaeota archaeon]
MAIKKRILFSYIIIIVFLISVSSNVGIFIEDSESVIDKNLKVNSIDPIVIDKVYNFTVATPTLEFNENLFFQQHYYYYIKVTVVSPHMCNISISIWDPKGDQFDITYETNMTQDDDREIPFGTVLEGNYSILFSADLTFNLNIHITIERGDKCLYEKIDLSEREDIIHYNISKFHNGKTIEFTYDFKTDRYYEFFFERVSTISVQLSNYVGMDHDVLDPQGIVFIIYRNESLGYINYFFGTAVEGLCTMNITIYCNVEWVNIAYVVVYKERISDIINPNDPAPPLPDDPSDNNTVGGIEAFIPFEGSVTVIILAGIAVIIPCAIVLYIRRRNAGTL